NPDASKIDLLVWPESIYSGLAPTMIWDRGQSVPATLGMDREQLEIAFGNLERANAMKLRRLRLASGGPLPNLLVGTDVIDIRNGAMDRYNSAVWIGNSGQPIDYYAKSHLVMFGEYIPVLSWFPSVMQSIGLATLSAGKEPKAWELASGRRVMTNVCFEDTVPHLMRSQVQRLTAQGKAPDVMINISNDGWFRGSSILDHHLNSAILTAVENRIPVLVAANTGITAWIDGDGRVIKRLPKMDAGWLVAEPIPDGRSGWWSTWGDWPAKFVSLIGLLPSILWIARRWSAKKTT
ncbi:MAG: apolipoprotein N-acyltransferase, partial [Planctomycetota bacterium]